MADVRTFLKSKSGLTFLALMITLIIGVLIGTVVSDKVSGSEKRGPKVAQLKIKGEGTPLILDREVSLAEGFSAVVQAVGPAVVNVRTEGIRRGGAARGQTPEALRDFFGNDFMDRFLDQQPRERKVTSLGTGVIVDSEGYLLTNHHVIVPDGNPADKISVQLVDGSSYQAKVLGTDPESDLAVLKIEADSPLPYAMVGDSSALSVGDWVLAIGSPFGLDHTVTSGIVSATERVVPTGIFGDYIQTDAAINPGNSGGPLVNMKGEVIGINSFMQTRSGGSQGVGFAIPSTVFINSYNQLVNKGRIERGWLGVSMNALPLTPEMADFFGVNGQDSEGIRDGDGVVITQLIDEDGAPAAGGPAYKAGVRAEDVIVQFNGREVETIWDLRAAVATTPPGESVPVTVVRKGRVLHLDIELAERTLEDQRRSNSEGVRLDPEVERKRDQEIGIEVRPLGNRDMERLGVKDEEGLLILDVTPGSLADDAGLQPEMIITHVNGEAVDSGPAFRDKVLSMNSGQGVVLRIVAMAQRQKTIAYTSFVKP